MAEEHRVGMVAALYSRLPDAEGALNALLADGVAYERLHLGAHDGDDPLRTSVPSLPERFWSIAVRPGEDDRRKLEERLGAYRPLSVGRLHASSIERTDSERGAVAWGHFVFESRASTNAQPEASGTSGTTGVVSSGAFADGAHVQREPDSDT